MVLDDGVGAAALDVLRKLTLFAGIDFFVPALVRALATKLVVGNHNDRVVKGLVHAGFEEQGHLDDDCDRRLLDRFPMLAKVKDPLTDHRPDQLLEPDPSLGLVEDRARDGVAINFAADDNVIAKSLSNFRDDRRIRVDLVYDLIGGQRRDAGLGETGKRRRFAGGNAAGQTDEQDFLLLAHQRDGAISS